MRVRRYLFGVLGCFLFSGTLIEAWRGSLGLCEEYYLIPKEKYGVLTSLRWQDIVFLVGFYLLLMGLSYVSYRLLKYAFRPRNPTAE